jgi:hypothetical protein
MHRLTVGNLRRVAVGTYNPQTMSPGTTRDRLVRSTVLGPLAPTDVFIRFAPELQTLLWGLRRRLRHRQPSRSIPVHVDLEFGGRHYRFALEARRDWICYYPQIPRVARSARFEIASGDRYLMGIPPCPGDVPGLLKRSERLLNRIVARARQPGARRGRARERWLKDIARYYQMMTVAHPFASQNNSLVMNQVNCLLFLDSGAHIPHGNLDGFALMLPAAAFERFFVDYLIDHRNGRPGASH